MAASRTGLTVLVAGLGLIRLLAQVLDALLRLQTYAALGSARPHVVYEVLPVDAPQACRPIPGSGSDHRCHRVEGDSLDHFVVPREQQRSARAVRLPNHNRMQTG